MILRTRLTALVPVVLMISTSTPTLVLGGIGVRPVSDEIRLSPRGPADQFAADHPSIVGGASDRIGVIWEAKRRDEQNQFGIRGRFFDFALKPLGTDFLVDTPAPPLDSNSSQASALFTDDGYWVAVWNQAKEDLLDEDNVAFLRTHLPGQTTTIEFVNTTKPWSQYHPSLASGLGGTWAVVWQNVDLDPPAQSIRVRVYDGGSATTGEISVDQGQSPFSTDGIGLRSENGLDVLWSGSIDLSNWHLFASHIGAVPLVGKQLSDDDGAARHPAAAELPDGRKIVAWREDGGGVPSGIRARIFDASYEPTGSETVVWVDSAPTQLRDKQPRIAASKSGKHSVVVWVLGDDHANTRDRDVVAQLLNARGEPVGPFFYVSEAHTGIDQQSPQVSFLTETSFVIVWSSEPDPEHLSVRVVGRLFTITSIDLCGDASGDGKLTAGDALTALRSAIGAATCPVCQCDVDGSGDISSVDALAILRSAVSFPASFSCPACEAPSELFN